MTADISKKYTFVDTTVGTRIVNSFIVAAAALKSRLPQPWQPASLPASYLSALDLNGERPPEQPNLLLVFPEMADLFDGSERLVAIVANPQYERKTFSSGIEYADATL